MLVVSPGKVVEAWHATSEMPDKVARGMDAIAKGQPEASFVLLVRDGAKIVGGPTGESLLLTAEDLEERWSVLLAEDLTAQARYHQLLVKKQRRPYMPDVAPETQWSASRYSALAKVEGVTLVTEIQSELDAWEVESAAVRREQAGYFSMMDAARVHYRSVVDGQAFDESLEAHYKGARG